MGKETSELICVLRQRAC